MLAYLNELNRDRSETEPNNRTVQRDAKVIAWQCLKTTFRSTSAKLEDILAALDDSDTAPERLQHLEKRLRLIQTIGAAQDIASGWINFGLSLPYYQGYSTSKNIHGNNSDRHQQLPTLDRLSQHIHICSSCNQAYRLSDRLKQIFVGIVIALTAFAIITDGSSIQLAAVSTSVIAVVLAIIAQKVRTRLERPYNRQAKDW
ncbi:MULTISPECIES: hypothetical protein [Fischerella]|uniref:hypothetical protein n=1 Tax=Fischerella TaxID=1190 RepID=UPI0002F37F51|nr:hypothetical protein [Fischerella muscicola]